ncbi:MAG: hypothetical protein HPY85_16155 [Anaerolineae bacterium]|nr:hypothetical protein [Anaerolineae bacterium]
MLKRQRMFGIVLYLLLFSLLSACTAGDDLPCPIPQALMDTPPADAVTLTITNNTCTTFCAVYVAPKTCDDWGLDWLGLTTLRSGESAVYSLPAGCYDLSLESCTGLAYNFSNYRLTGDRELTLDSRDAQTRGVCDASVTVVNHAAVPICYLWMATAESESFGGNWLGADDPLLPGETAVFPIFPDTYDLKVEDCDFNILRLELGVAVDEPLVWEVGE